VVVASSKTQRSSKTGEAKEDAAEDEDGDSFFYVIDATSGQLKYRGK